jgi:hypothetical protein
LESLVSVITSPESHNNTRAAAPYLGEQISALRNRVTLANTPANLEGLFARHVVGDRAGIAWNVQPPAAWSSESANRTGDPAVIAVLGYSVTDGTLGEEGRTRLLAGLPKLMQRDPFPGDRISFVHHTVILLGVTLATRAVRTDLSEASSWLASVLADPRLQPSDTLHDLVRRHAQAILTTEPFRLPDLAALAGREEMAMAYWTLVQGTGQLANPQSETLFDLQRHLLHAALTADPKTLSPPVAALLLDAVTSIITSSVDHLVRDRSQVGVVLRRFPAAMRRWRWDPDTLQRPIRWEVTSEREVQDILWIMLRSVFDDDVIDEETLPKFGLNSYRADFGLPRLGVLIEVKYARQAEDFKKIEQEVMIDSVAYLKKTDRYREIVVFIYDASGSVQYYDTTRRTLLDLENVTDVIIVSSPGMLPKASRQSQSRDRRRGRAKATGPKHTETGE